MRPRTALLAGTAAVATPAAAVAVLLAVGQSQVAAVAPTAGNEVFLVREAGVDLLLARGVPVGTAPVCADAGATITCRGARADGAPIVVEAPSRAAADGPLPVTVTVAGVPLVTAPAQDVVDAAGSRR